jgi:hypothetical protein
MNRSRFMVIIPRFTTILYVVLFVPPRNSADDRRSTYLGCRRNLHRSVATTVIMPTCGHRGDFAASTASLGTPHTLHYSNAADAIKAGKHVLVEKPATTNAKEFRALVALARTHGVFLMEAMWTRFQPIAHAIKGIIDQGALGAPVMVHADLSADFDIESESVACSMSVITWRILKLAHRHPVDAPNPRPNAWRRCNLGLVSRCFQHRTGC